jgi:AbrB family looped-hinge helix DNA binding protein
MPIYVVKLSSKGQLVIPAPLRAAHRWRDGDEFVVEEVGQGLLLKPRKPFAATRLEDVAGSLPYAGPAKTVEEMDKGVAAWLRTSVSDDAKGRLESK